jgi:hypothetical protein
MTVGELLNKISSMEITEWKALMKLEYEEKQVQASLAEAKRQGRSGGGPVDTGARPPTMGEKE